MRREIFEYLRENIGISVNEGYYSKIEEWLAWWRGAERTFHQYWENGAGGYPIRRELYRLNMAKKICEDWAAVLINDKTYISAADEVKRDFIGRYINREYLRGANRLVEKAFAVGTGACLMRINNASLDSGGKLCRFPDGAKMPDISFDFVDATHIIPITVRGGRVCEAAFVSEMRERGEEYVYIEIHTLEKDGYRIRNEKFRIENGCLCRVYETGELAGDIRTGTFIPFFSILTPNITNNIDEGCGMGVSVFADAVDCLKGVDLAFNNFCRDIKLGGKKVFINQSLIYRDDDGNIYTPDDVAQQLFITIGDTDITEKPMITEHNPDLRSGENAEAVQSQLDYLSFRCGLGTHHYKFRSVQGEAKLTATQYMGERQDMRQNAAKHYINIEDFINQTIAAVCWAGEFLCGLRFGDETVSIRFDDSYFTDSESERTRDLNEVELGIMSRDEFRLKWYC